MPEFTIAISDTLLANLQTLAAQFNANNGTNFSVKEWVLHELKSSASQEELGRYIRRRQEELQKEGQQQIDAEIRTEKDRLMEELS